MGLKGIPAIITPHLLQVLSSMGHGDEIVLADIHFPTSSVCKNGPIEVRADGHSIPVLLEAILTLFPLDTYAIPCALMDMVDSDKSSGLVVPWDQYINILSKAEGRSVSVVKEERFDFYERAKRSYAVVHTGDTAKYGNIILKKGLVDYANQ